MRVLFVILTLSLSTGCSPTTTKPNGKNGAERAVSEIENASGRWLQVDVYDSAGKPFDTVNLAHGDKCRLSGRVHKVEIRVSGKTAQLDGSPTKITINRREDLEIQK